MLPRTMTLPPLASLAYLVWSATRFHIRFHAVPIHISHGPWTHGPMSCPTPLPLSVVSCQSTAPRPRAYVSGGIRSQNILSWLDGLSNLKSRRRRACHPGHPASQWHYNVGSMCFPSHRKSRLLGTPKSFRVEKIPLDCVIYMNWDVKTFKLRHSVC